MKDFSVANHGSICLLTAHTEEARTWADTHLSNDCMMWGQSSIVVEPRYIGDIVEGITRDGLEVWP